MRGRTWKAESVEALSRVRDLLRRRGAIEDTKLKNPYELWRVRIDKVVFTAYTTGTLYCNGGGVPELPFLYKSVSEVLGQTDAELSART
jgi:ribonuclease HIII